MNDQTQVLRFGAAPPPAPSLPTDFSVPDIAIPSPSAMVVFRVWLKFGLAYNIILALVATLTASWTALQRNWLLLVQYGLVANVCFIFIGTWFEAFLSACVAKDARNHRSFLRWLLFLVVTVLGSFLTFCLVIIFLARGDSNE